MPNHKNCPGTAQGTKNPESILIEHPCVPAKHLLCVTDLCPQGVSCVLWCLAQGCWCQRPLGSKMRCPWPFSSMSDQIYFWEMSSSLLMSNCFWVIFMLWRFLAGGMSAIRNSMRGLIISEYLAKFNGWSCYFILHFYFTFRKVIKTSKAMLVSISDTI